MLVKISSDEANHVTVSTLREAYIACMLSSRNIRTTPEDKERYLDLSVGFPIVLKYFLSDAEYFDFMEQLEEEINDR